MASSYMTVSVLEADKRIAEERNRRRIVRMKQVREQERCRAAFVRDGFRERMRRDSRRHEEKKQRSRVDEFRERKKQILVEKSALESRLGTSHREAQMVVNDVYTKACTDYWTFLCERDMEGRRGNEALKYFQEEKCDTSMEERQSRFREARALENYRAKQAVLQLQKRKAMPSLCPKPMSLPVPHVYDSPQFPVAKYRKPRIVRYTQNGTEDAYERADYISRELLEKRQREKSMRRAMMVKSQARAIAAYKQENTGQRRKAFEKDLELLWTSEEDHKRKTLNDECRRTREGHDRVLYRPHSVGELNRRFEKMFLEAEPEGTPVRAHSATVDVSGMSSDHQSDESSMSPLNGDVSKESSSDDSVHVDMAVGVSREQERSPEIRTPPSIHLQSELEMVPVADSSSPSDVLSMVSASTPEEESGAVREENEKEDTSPLRSTGSLESPPPDSSLSSLRSPPPSDGTPSVIHQTENIDDTEEMENLILEETSRLRDEALVTLKKEWEKYLSPMSSSSSTLSTSITPGTQKKDISASTTERRPTSVPLQSDLSSLSVGSLSTSGISVPPSLSEKGKHARKRGGIENASLLSFSLDSPSGIDDSSGSGSSNSEEKSGAADEYSMAQITFVSSLDDSERDGSLLDLSEHSLLSSEKLDDDDGGEMIDSDLFSLLTEENLTLDEIPGEELD